MSDLLDLINKLSLDEKIRLVVGAGVSKRVHGAAGESRPVDRLNIPSIIFSDGPAAVRIFPLKIRDKNTYYTTAFPNAILLASTWDLDLVERVGRAMGEEAREYGVDILLAPGLNIHRTPLGGRNFEYYSEDPLLSGEMAGAFVRGVQSTGVAATLKHFVANDQETNRHTIDTIVSERALREIYLRAFEIAIEKSKPKALMAAYNKLNGVYCAQSRWLLTKVLRDEWGFEGLVMTDWGAGDNPVEQINAGIDIIMPGEDKIVSTLLEAVKRGEISEETLNLRVSRVLSLVLDSLTARGYKPSYKPDLEMHARLAREAASEGFVLLKNDRALPIKPGSRVALFGVGSYATIRGGLGSGFSYARYTVSIYQGLKEEGFIVDEEIAKTYLEARKFDWADRLREFRERFIVDYDEMGVEWVIEDYIDSIATYYIHMSIPENHFSDDSLEKYAERNDIAIITISRVSGEGFDRLPVKGDFYLRDDERDLILRVSRVFHRLGKKVIVILNIPSPIEIVSWRDLVDAILVIWMPGQEAGRAVADVVSGRVSPSGKLPLTWPRELFENPATRSWPGEPRENPSKIVYEEDIFVGYRYYDTFRVDPAYEFGYGLSYTRFEYRDLSIRREKDQIIVEFSVRNIGEFSGREVAQVYVRAPRGRISKPYQELRGFHKTRVLRPGEEERVVIRIPVRYLSSFDRDRWVVEKGLYEFRIGSSSRDIRLRGYIEISEEVCYDTSWRNVEC
ncbi:MAG: beta-glucosidase [Sulfolobales archaeon]